MNKNKSTQICLVVTAGMLLSSLQLNAGIPEQYVAERGLEMLTEGIKYLAGGIALAGLFIGIGIAMGKRKG